MNRHHFAAFVWLRWRLLVNQLRRGGMANAVILGICAVLAVFFAVGMFFGLFSVGLFVLGDVSPAVILYVWDGLVVPFLFMWTLGLLIELQRTEALSLERFLHLPVSLSGAFLINYLSSLFSLTLLVFLPAMIGLTLGLVLSRGPALLLLLPLLAAFLLMVTALTYQFQGWLASLMVNKRRRRTVIVIVTAAFILMFQLPNLINILRPWDVKDEDAEQRDQKVAALKQALAAGEIDGQEYWRREAELQREYHARVEERRSDVFDQVERTARLVNLALPPGWLPLGAAGAAEGRLLPPLLATLGMGLIGTLSLWRAYRTTVRLYTGQFGTAKPRKVPAAAPAPVPGAPVRANPLERRLPWVSERVAVIALASFRSLIRAPEVKMMLLTPLILVVIFGAMFLRKSSAVTVPEALRPLAAFGGVVMTLFTLGQLIGNQFGYDRSGFRLYVLSAAPRRDILLGKNLAVAPLALGMGGVVLVLMELLQPMRFDHFLALLPQVLTAYLPFCLLANALSIFAPMAIRAGSFKPASPKGTVFLFHMLFALLCPLVLAPALLPLVIEFVLEDLGWVSGIPIDLLLSLVWCVVALWLYRLVLAWEGSLLQAREQKIVELVTTKAE